MLGETYARRTEGVKEVVYSIAVRLPAGRAHAGADSRLKDRRTT